MTSASPSLNDHTLDSAAAVAGGKHRVSRAFAPWQIVSAAVVSLVAFVASTPDGMAQPLQDFAGWLLVGGVATFALLVIAKGLERLLDCEAD